MNDELNFEDLENVQAGYVDYEGSINEKISNLENQLNNPECSVEERKAIYKNIEQLQEQLQEVRENRSTFQH